MTTLKGLVVALAASSFAVVGALSLNAGRDTWKGGASGDWAGHVHCRQAGVAADGSVRSF